MGCVFVVNEENELFFNKEYERNEIYKSSENPQGNKGRGNGYGEKLTLGQQGFWGSLHPWGFSEDL